MKCFNWKAIAALVANGIGLHAPGPARAARAAPR